MKNSTKNRELIYLLDDDPVFSQALELWFESQDYSIQVFQTSDSFFKEFKMKEPDVVILDFNLDESGNESLTGADVAKKINASHADLPIIILSGQANIQTAVDLFSINIIDYVAKDNQFHLNLKQILQNLKEMRRLRFEVKRLKQESKMKLKRILIVLSLILLFWLSYLLLM